MSVFYHPFTISMKSFYLKLTNLNLLWLVYQHALPRKIPCSRDLNQVEKHGPKGILKGTPEAVLQASILKPKYLMSNDKPYSIFTLFVAHFLLFTNLFN